MTNKPNILTIEIADNGAAAAMIDDGQYDGGQKKAVYRVDKTRIRQFIEKQFSAIRENDLDEVQQIGRVLAQHLLPKEIRAKLPKDGEALLLSTNEHDIPWELLWEGAFLGVRFAMGRQLITADEIRIPRPAAGKPEKTCLILTNPTEDLPESEKEALQLMRYFREHGIACTLLAGKQITSADILIRMASQFDIVHYSGHIDIDEKGACLRLADGDDFYLKEALTLDGFGRPFIFLNGCGGGPAWGSSTSIVKPLIYAGCGSILCATMPITDKGSRIFSEQIISNVLRGMPYGKATMEARRQFCSDSSGGMDWMCFAYYGNPLEGMDAGDMPSSVYENSSENMSAADIPGPFAQLKTVLGRADGLTGDVYVISTSHLFAALLMGNDPDITKAFQGMNVSSDMIQTIISMLFNAPAQPEIRPVPVREKYSENAWLALKTACDAASGQGRRALPRDLCKALLAKPCMLTEILKALDIDYEKLIEKL